MIAFGISSAISTRAPVGLPVFSSFPDALRIGIWDVVSGKRPSERAGTRIDDLPIVQSRCRSEQLLIENKARYSDQIPVPPSKSREPERVRRAVDINTLRRSAFSSLVRTTLDPALYSVDATRHPYADKHTCSLGRHNGEHQEERWHRDPEPTPRAFLAGRV